MGQAPPQISPDGKFYWDGTAWRPLEAPLAAAPGGFLAAPQPRLAYGGVLIRFVAYFIDSLIISIPTTIVFVLLAAAGVLATPCDPSVCAPPPPGGTATGALTVNPSALAGFELFAAILAGLYFVYFWGSSGSSLGMRLFRLRVVDASTGQPIGAGRATLRYIGFIVAAIPCWIGLIWAAFDPRAQGWHDKIASTVVLQG